MSRFADRRKFSAAEIGLNAVAGNGAAESSNLIPVNNYKTASLFFKFTATAGAGTAVTWKVVGGFDGSTDEYPITSASASSGAVTWNDRSETFTLASTGTSENFVVRYDVLDFDWIKVKSVAVTNAGGATETVTVDVNVSSD